MDQQSDELLSQAEEACRDPAFRDVIWRHCSYLDPSAVPRRLSTRIHPNDQMLRHSLNHWHDVNRSLSQYFNVALQQHNAAQQILRLFFDRPDQGPDILDFACGYGRHLRFLTLSVPSSRVWGAEIQRDAVDFVIAEFGVNGLYSATDPKQFRPGRKFDFIWVASLFSHLPSRLFREWLAALDSVLKPDGVLCFSVHDERLLPAHLAMPDDGIHFIPESENAELDTSAYGTTFVSESFVGGAIGETLETGRGYLRIKRGLANEQDLYVVPKRRDVDLRRLAPFRYGTWGWVDECRVSDGGELYLYGWAASLDDGPLDAVEVIVNGRKHLCSTGVSREDVRAVLGDDRLGLCGWAFEQTIEAHASPALVEVTARSARNEVALLYAGKLAIPGPAG